MASIQITISKLDYAEFFFRS